MPKSKRLKTLWEVVPACGCVLARYTTVRKPSGDNMHSADSARDPIICPKCKQATWVRRGYLRRA